MYIEVNKISCFIFSDSNFSQALERIGHVDEVINDPEYVLISISDQLTRTLNTVFFYCGCNVTDFLNFSYKFEFPTPDDRPGPPIISFRSDSLCCILLMLTFGVSHLLSCPISINLKALLYYF